MSLKRILISILLIYYVNNTLAKKSKSKRKNGSKSRKKGGKGNPKAKNISHNEDKKYDTGPCWDYDDDLESCLSMNYKPKLMKCAEGIYKIVHHGVADPDEDVDRTKYGQESRSSNIMSVGTGFKKKSKGLKRPKRRALDTYVLTPKEEKGCRLTERKIHKSCETITEFACEKVDEAEALRRFKKLEEKGRKIGGFEGGDLADPLAAEGLKAALAEFKRRAFSLGNMKPRDSIFVGDLLDYKTQVVAGTKYVFTLELGITNDASCKQKSVEGVVSKGTCKDYDSLGEATISVVLQSWTKAPWKWFDYEVGEGGPPKKLYWDESYVEPTDRPEPASAYPRPRRGPKMG